MAGPGIAKEMEESEQIDDLIDLTKVEGRVQSSTVKKISEIIDQHPQEAVNIIRSWLYSDNKR